jgi:hypothetical protein
MWFSRQHTYTCALFAVRVHSVRSLAHLHDREPDLVRIDFLLADVVQVDSRGTDGGMFPRQQRAVSRDSDPEVPGRGGGTGRVRR